ncbi:MAG: anhydro-N-acetylmuramic acid kinase [Dysgonamonadaceae bacterium]|jgi:anhydro-N-acetylmuramic acid kinase|nr:anhydro-N-acetylmuramic acid kinase [Dysgonamonadaceae bacterium]
MDYRIIGLMSGTSLDGLDLAFVHFYPASGAGNVSWNYTILCAESMPYTAGWREKLRAAYYQTAEGIAALDAEYGRYLGQCVKDFVDRHRLERVDFVASHGHTVFHRPDAGYNLQIGNGAHLHAVSGRKVICDFRTLDIAFGGQGAPLVPIGDKLLFGEQDYCLNIGGFANVSFDDDTGRRIAYDLCPANYCLNRLMRTRGAEYDRDGQTARSGKVNRALWEALNALEYYHRPAPKSLAQEWVDACVMPLVDACSDTFENKMATLTEHAAFQIARPFKPGGKVLVTGGGAYNTYLLERAAASGSFTWVRPDPAVIDFKEALIFAFLGLRRAEGLPNCLQTVTGASHDVVAGQMYGFAAHKNVSI